MPDFVLERLEGLLDVPVEFVRAARASAVTELGAVARLAQTLAAEAGSEAFANAYTAFDRANRLAGQGGRRRPGDRSGPGRRACRAGAPGDARRKPARGSTPPSQARDFDAALDAAAELGPPVDRFFDEVLVMAEDERVRANRLRLLLDVRDAVGALGDLSQIPR